MSVSCFEQNHTRRYETCTVSLHPSSQLRHNPARLKKSSQAGAAPTHARSVIRLKKGTQTMITYYRTVAFDDLSVFSRKSHRLTLRRFYCSTAFRLPRTCSENRSLSRVSADLPGSGFTDAPDRTNFTYSFDHLTDVIERFTEVLGPRSGCAHL